MEQDKLNEIVTNQRDFMRLLDEFFTMVTGDRICDYRNADEITDKLGLAPQESTSRLIQAHEWLHPKLQEYYSSYGDILFPTAQKLPGIKPVLGGSSRFTLSSLNSIQQLFLYSDTILIPDPILPWLEVDRDEERFRNIHFLRTVYFLLHLKPFIDLDDVAYPPVFVFPSWEKSLEAHDLETKTRIDGLTLSVISNELDIIFSSIDEIKDYAMTHTDEFLTKIEECQLFVPPGSTPGESLSTAIIKYKEEIDCWRSESYKTAVLRLSDPLLVLHGIRERITPQFHLLENADELGASPFTSLRAHWHYLQKCNSHFILRLSATNILSERTVAEMNALQRNEFSWLSNISIDDLVQLRRTRENELFRKRIRDFTQVLHEATLNDLDKVALEVSQGLNSLIAEHGRALDLIARKYSIEALKTGAVFAVSAGVAMVPTLAPYLGHTPLLVPAAKLAFDTIKELVDERSASRSLIGILSAASNN